VIGFALTAFAAVLVKRVYKVTGTDDSDALRMTDS
jgi:multisubunit Na+/H+ antiporter MnhC subunit